MRRADILAGSTSGLRSADCIPANDNDPPEPPPAASQRVPRLPPLLAAIAAFGANRTDATVPQAARPTVAGFKASASCSIQGEPPPRIGRKPPP